MRIILTFWVGFHRPDGGSLFWGPTVEDGSLNIPRYVDVGVPHFGQKPKGRKGEKAVDGELEACLEVATLS